MADESSVTAKISIQRGVISLSAEGSETFVREAMTMWDSLAGGAANAEILTETGSGSMSSPASAVGPRSQISGGIGQFENVYDEVDGRLKLIAHVPGTSKADKTRNVALLVLYGHYLRGDEQIPSETIRDACADQGCFDASNFAQYLKGLKERVAMNTKPGGGYDVKLTAPGRKAARELVDSLNGGSVG